MNRILLGISLLSGLLLLSCKLPSQNIKIIYLKKMDIMNHEKIMSPPKNVIYLFKFYLVRGKGSNKSLTEEIFKKINGNNNFKLQNEINKYFKVQLYFFRITSKTNLSTIKEDPSIIQAYYNQDEICEITWEDGKLLGVDYLVHDTYRNFLDAINK